MKPTTTNIKTFLPLFSGFYNTIWDFETTDFENENNCIFDELIIDYNEYNNDVVLGICAFIKENCEFIKSIKFENINSPKFYNYSNDSANITIDIDLQGFKAFIYANKKAFNQYFKDNYTSCDGFMSSFENSFEGWKIDTNNFNDLNNHYLGALLQCYFQINGITEYNAYECNEIYIDSYITIERITTDSQKLELVKELDFSFGYLSIIYNECLQKSELLNIDVYELLLEQSEIINEIELLTV